MFCAAPKIFQSVAGFLAAVDIKAHPVVGNLEAQLTVGHGKADRNGGRLSMFSHIVQGFLEGEKKVPSQGQSEGTILEVGRFGFNGGVEVPHD